MKEEQTTAEVWTELMERIAAVKMLIVLDIMKVGLILKRLFG